MNLTSLPASVFWKSAMTGSLAVFSTEKPTMLMDLSSEEVPPPLEAAHPARTAGMAVAATARAASLIRLVM